MSSVLKNRRTYPPTEDKKPQSAQDKWAELLISRSLARLSLLKFYVVGQEHVLACGDGVLSMGLLVNIRLSRRCSVPVNDLL